MESYPEKLRITHRCGHKKTYRIKPGKFLGVQMIYPTLSCRKCQMAAVAKNRATVFGEASPEQTEA